MFLSPINYQMGLMQSTSLKQNNSPNFKSKDAVIIKEVPTIKSNRAKFRCKETYYSEGERPLWNNLLEQFTKGFARKTVKPYTNLTGGTNTETVYYDTAGNVLASVYDCNGMHEHMTLKTPEKDFIDWGKTGIVDCYIEDEIVEKNDSPTSYLERSSVFHSQNTNPWDKPKTKK